MLRKRGLRILGLSYVIIGVFFLFSSFSGIIGYIIAENISITKEFLFYFGINLVFIGIIIFIAITPKI